MVEPRGAIKELYHHLNELNEAANIPGPSWPDGGIFVYRGAKSGKGPILRNIYNPLDSTDKIILDVQRLPGGDPKALLRFVNKWGSLGLGIPGYDRHLFPYDSVSITDQQFIKWRTWIKTFYALQNKEKVLISEAGLDIGADEIVMKSFKKKCTYVTWEVLGLALNLMLRKIRPAVHISEDGEGLRPDFRVSCLADAIAIELWNMATTGRFLRPCKGCRALFIPERINQYFCDRGTCENSFNVRRSKSKKRAIELYRKGVKTKDIATQINENIKTVKGWLKQVVKE